MSAFHAAVRRALDDIAVDEHADDVGQEIAEREDRKDVSVPSVMRAIGGHDLECECHICSEIAVDEARLRGRW